MGRIRRSRATGPQVTRRRLLVGGAAALGAAATVNVAAAPAARAESQPSPGSIGSAVEPCWGAHQAGIATPPQAVAVFVALALRRPGDQEALVRLMRLWTDDIERLTQGVAALADAESELAGVPARLTVTVGYGPGFFDVPGLQSARPEWLRPLPDFAVDKLQARWSGGDLFLQVAADDPITVSHALRVLLADAGEFARVVWTQRGFHRAAGATAPGSTGRNLMGQVDGTVNPQPGTADFDRVVWVSDGPDWLNGGTGVVVRRIRMDLHKWASIDRSSREKVVGRRLADGAPLTGTSDTDPPDFDAVSDNGLLVIPEFAHIRLAHPQHPTERILRRPYNYDDGLTADGEPDAGLLFVACAADPTRQFTPIQRRLDNDDLLNVWTTPVGSAVFAIPPGFERGGWLGQTLLD